MQTTKNRRGRSATTRGRRAFSSSAPRTRSGKFNGGRPRWSGKGRKAGGRRKTNSFNPSQFINTNPVDTVKETFTPKHNFGSFGLDARLARSIASMGLEIPTPIQDQVIPEILAGRDVIGLAETGTGKTAAFLIPLIEDALKNPEKQALILAPTRELALQIGDELRRLSGGLRIFSTVCVGGMNIRPQINALRRRNQFIIGTPGRVLDLLRRKHFIPRKVSAVVLDEADRMLDMGFIHDMRAILSATPTDRKTLFFSATMTGDAKGIVNDFLRDPISISVKKKDVTNSIEQNIVRYENHNKFETLLKLLSDPESKRVLIFGAMKHSVEQLARQLSTKGAAAESIHGNKNHTQRQRALAKFKRGEARVLVATDVAARGIHIDDVTHVINYDLPNTFEDYVHRIGRTGRAAKRGKALTFVPATAKF